jgi:hypothetical protein
VTSPAAAADPNVDFLAASAPVIYNLVPDKDGVVHIDRKLLGDRQLVQIYAEDLRDAVWKEVALPDLEPKLKDLLLTRNLDPAKTFAERKEISVLTTGQTLTLPDLLTSELETYDTFGSIFGLYLTLSANDTLAKFAWLLEWPKLKDEEKRAKYSEFACHELNFLLSRKDSDFFTKVVQRYLRNKKEKTFLDDYLFGADVRRYLEPWRFAQLNAVERALLASRLQAEGPGIARHLKELWELLPPQPDETDRLFETALLGRAMDGENDVSGAMDGAKANLWARQPGKISTFANEPQSAPAGAVASSLALRTRGDATTDRFANIADLKAEVEELAKVKKQLELSTAEAKERQSSDNSAAYFALNGTGSNTIWQLSNAEGLREKPRQPPTTAGSARPREWAENNYYHLPIEQQNAQLIPVNAFWRDFAAWMAAGAKAPFLSSNFTEAHRNFSEIMFALAVLDLPFEAGEAHDEDRRPVIHSDRPPALVLAVHKQIKPAAPAPGQTELLVSQNFYRQGDRYRQEATRSSISISPRSSSPAQSTARTSS